MNKKNDLQHYLSISPNKFGIYLFDTKSLKNLYKEEITFNRDRDLLNYDLLKRFLDDNVLKIEKLNKKFVDNIILIIEDNKICFFKSNFFIIHVISIFSIKQINSKFSLRNA